MRGSALGRTRAAVQNATVADERAGEVHAQEERNELSQRCARTPNCSG